MAPTANRPLRVGLLGFGVGGRVFHAPLIAATEGLELAAVATSAPERRAELERSHPGARAFATAEALLAARAALGLDLVVVATPNDTHVPLARAALEAGLPVVVDKPVAPSAAEARGLAALASRQGLLLTVFQNRRWDGDFLTVRRLLAEDALGPVRRFESRFERWAPVARAGWKERPAPEAASGLLYDLGSHLVDQALQLFGPVRTVYAELERHRPGSTVDDDDFLALGHASGVRSHLWMSKVAAQRGPRFRVIGARAAFTKHGLDGQEPAMAAGAIPGRPGWGEEPPSAFGLLGSTERRARCPPCPATTRPSTRGWWRPCAPAGRRRCGRRRPSPRSR